MSLLSLVLLGCVLFFILTAVVGGVLDLPWLSTFRATLAERHIKPWAVVVALSPPITAALDLPARVATLGKLPIGPTTAFSLIGGMFFTAALAGC